MDSASWKVANLMTQFGSQFNKMNETFKQIVAELEKQAAENEKHNQEQLKEIIEKQRKLDEDKAIIEKLAASASPIVCLNVGGEKMKTYRATLTADESSSLTIQFSGNWEEKLHKDEDGYIFLDYDPTLFKYLLNQLRTWSNPSVERVLRPPTKDKEIFLKLVRSLNFDERYIDSGKSIISNVTTTAQSQEEIEQSADRETSTATGTTAATESQQKFEQSTGVETNNTSDTAATPPQEQVEQSTAGGAGTATSTNTATEPQQKAKQSTNSEVIITAKADNVTQPVQEAESFRTTYTDEIQLTDNNRKCQKIHKSGNYQSILGTLTYSSGIHRIRLKVEKGISDIFLGICCQTKPPTGAYLYDQPTVHGWFIHGYVVKNGQSLKRGGLWLTRVIF